MTNDTVPIRADLPAPRVNALVPSSMAETIAMADALSRAGDMIPRSYRGNPGAIVAAILRGLEIGLAPLQALSNIEVINGRPCVWGDAIPALVIRAGHHIDDELAGEDDAMVATATLTRADGRKFVRTFSVADAKRANLWGKQGPWTQYPQRMLRMRARSWAARDGAADALMGLAVAEEAQDIPVEPERRSPIEYLSAPAAPQKAAHADSEISAATTPPPAAIATTDLPAAPQKAIPVPPPSLIFPDGTSKGGAKGVLQAWSDAWTRAVSSEPDYRAAEAKFVAALASARSLYRAGPPAKLITELVEKIGDIIDSRRSANEDAILAEDAAWPVILPDNREFDR